jgi:CubicO group peptidase (beta-lactamase class C family)
MKIKFILVQALLVLVFFFWEIGLIISGKGAGGSEQNKVSAGFTSNLRNQFSSFESSEKLDETILSFQKKWGIKGMSVAITKDGRLVYAKGFGYANKEAGETVEPGHLFRIASVSKLITAITIMHLTEEGMLELDDHVFGPGGILNDPQYLNYTDPRVEQITVRQLLTHTGGWSRRSGDPMFTPHIIARKMDVDLPVDCETIIRYTLRKKLNYTPGTRYSYSNLGYVILGKVIEKVTGIGYEDYVKIAILNPLGIYDMHLGNSYPEEKAVNEVIYYEAFKSAKVLAYDTHKDFVPKTYGGSDIKTLGAAGGWIASPAEMLKLVVAVDGFDTKPDILQPESIRIMTSKGKTGREMMGWKGSDGHGTWWRTGTLTGTSALVVRQSNGINWIVVTNTTTSRKSRIHSETSRMMFRAIAGMDGWPSYDLFEYQPSRLFTLVNPAENQE